MVNPIWKDLEPVHRSCLLISRTGFFLLLALATAAATPQEAATPRRADPQPAAHPNVLFIAVDDLRPELGCYGAAHVKSPQIDRLAASGVIFDHAYCQQAACNQSRASLLTGLRPDTLKVYDLHTPFRRNKPDVITLPQCFKNNGYHTVATGKIFHNTIPDPPSWSEPKMHIDGYPFDPDAVYRDEDNIRLQEQRKKEIIEKGLQKRYIDPLGQWYLKTVATEHIELPDDAYYDGAQTERAIAKMEELAAGNEPFFLAVGYYRPHLPFNAPRRDWDLYDRATLPLAANPFLARGAPPMAINTMRELRGYLDFRTAPRPDQGSLTEAQARLLRHGYLASVSYVDRQIGRLLDALERCGLDERTIVVLWGDHGWKLGEHNSWCKMTNYEIDTRVPLIIRVPGAPASGRRCRRLVELVDLYPTLCELAEITPPPALEGVSAAPLLADPARPWKKSAFSLFLREGPWVAPDGVVYMGRAIRTARYRYVEWRVWESGERVARELYDVERDPQENRNIADRPAMKERVEELAARLQAGWRAARPER